MSQRFIGFMVQFFNIRGHGSGNRLVQGVCLVARKNPRHFLAAHKITIRHQSRPGAAMFQNANSLALLHPFQKLVEGIDPFSMT